MPTDATAIVIIEDDTFLQHLYQVKFVGSGYSVHVAGDGEAGLALVRQVHPAAVLLDVEMPKLNGLSVLRQLKTDPATSAIPVVMLTNTNSPENLERARSLGAADYLVKAQLLPSEVVATVDKLIGQKLSTRI